MNWVEGVVCIAAIIGLCAIADMICCTVRNCLGHRPRRWADGGYASPAYEPRSGAPVDVTTLGGGSPPGPE